MKTGYIAYQRKRLTKLQMETNLTTKKKQEKQLQHQQNARILFYDLEVSPILGWTYGRYEENLIKVEREQEIMSISWRWQGEKKIHHMNLHYTDEKSLMLLIRDLLDEADIVVAHNANRFDNRMSAYGFLRHNLTPPSHYKTVDTLRAAKSIGKFSSNKLTDLCELFGIGVKTQTTYASLWHDCLIKNDKKAWNKMQIYNDQDVVLVQGLYEKLRPYITNHPNIGNIVGRPDVCPNCGSDKLHARGERHTSVSSYRRFCCKSCGHWCSSRQAIKEAVKPNFVNYS